MKPDEFYNLIREMSPEPRIDVFSRRIIAGFDCWGDESPNESQEVLSNLIVPPSNSPTASANAENIICVKEENQK